MPRPKPITPADIPPENFEPDAYSVEEFCRRHRISLQLFKRAMSEGIGPKVIRLGTRVIISKEAAQEWREKRGQ